MKLSVIIPAYEMHGVGGIFLSQSLAILAAQDLSDFEVVVGDQSDDDSIAEACARYDGRIPIKLVDTRSARGNPSENINRAYAAASGEIIKFLFQDDFLSSTDALRLTVEAFDANPAAQWLVSAFDHSTDGIIGYRPYLPILNERLRFGVNTLGPPSVVAVRREAYEPFSGDLVWLMDVAVYDRLLDKHGPPVILDQFLVCSREWARQNTKELGGSRKAREILDAVRPHGVDWPGATPGQVLAVQDFAREVLLERQATVARSGVDAARHWQVYLRLQPFERKALVALAYEAEDADPAARDAARSLLVSNFLTDHEILSRQMRSSRTGTSDFASISDYLDACGDHGGSPCRLLRAPAGRPHRLDGAFHDWLARQAFFVRRVQGPAGPRDESDRLVDLLLDVIGSAGAIAGAAGRPEDASWTSAPSFGSPGRDSTMPAGGGRSSFIAVNLCSSPAEAAAAHTARLRSGPLGGFTVVFNPAGTYGLNQGGAEIRQDAVVSVTQIAR